MTEERKADIERQLMILEHEIDIALAQDIQTPIVWCSTHVAQGGALVVATLTIVEIDRKGRG